MARAPVSIYRGVNSQIGNGGEPVIAVYAGALWAKIVNPFNAADQNLATAEPLFVDLINPAATEETATTFALLPGESFIVPPFSTDDVTVNAASGGHMFSIVVVQPATPYPPMPPTPGSFPPSGPTTVLQTIPSYLYTEYADDDDLQAFVASYNALAQQYLDWLNTVNLPVYTGAPISGSLLDWVAQGLYGITRPALASGSNSDLGPYNTAMLNELPYNGLDIITPAPVATSDDIFKRIITWNYYRGDGRVFTVPWLKRRIMRFLEGTDGSAPSIDNTWQISVSFGIPPQINIRLLTQQRIVTQAALYNEFMMNEGPFIYNYLNTEIDFDYPPLPNAAIFAEALQAGVLQLPFQYEFTVSVGG